MSLQTQSTTRGKPLARDDESVRRARFDIVFGSLVPACCLLLVLWVIAFVEWQWLSGGMRPNPIYSTGLAGLITVYVVLRVLPDIRRLQHPTLDDDVIRATRDYLDRLRGLGFRVFHDVPGDSENIDHVIISTHGVYTVETKMRGRHSRGQGRVSYDGRALSVDGGPADETPIMQATARAAQFRRILKEQTGADLQVRAVVLFPGWSIESRDAHSRHEVWVLPPKALPMRIRHAPETIHGREVKQVANRLAAYLREYESR